MRLADFLKRHKNESVKDMLKGTAQVAGSGINIHGDLLKLGQAAAAKEGSK
ncbi:hypothetical protein ACIBJC_14670 [Streptomyces sp. NPDC050509]|uniref:hypothetical protein n=1 Tax=Streptomyces sp. NPDC050509 TaxID=3365620 RepID=UPI0037AC6E45